jgi:hypothetical protein
VVRNGDDLEAKRQHVRIKARFDHLIQIDAFCLTIRVRSRRAPKPCSRGNASANAVAQFDSPPRPVRRTPQ